MNTVRGYSNVIVREELRDCACRQYTGPTPLTTYLTPQLTDTETERNQR